MMKKFAFSISVLAFAVLLDAAPYVGYVYPAGMQQGSKARILIGGQKINQLNGCVISGEGVKVKKITIIPGFPHPDGQQRRYLMEWIKRIENGFSSSPQEIEKIENWRKNRLWDQLDQLPRMEFDLVVRYLNTRRNPLQMSPSLRQMAIIDLECDRNAPPGKRTFRVWNNRGVSAPKPFYIDPYPHQGQRKFTPPGKELPPMPEVFKTPAVLDGQIMPGETDSFKVLLDKGEHTFTVKGRAFQPFIGDAVPGHFQPVIRVLTMQGRELAFADDDYFDPDPVLRFKVPWRGWFIVEVRDNLYRGREDFVYRVAIEKGRQEYQFCENKPFAQLPKIQETDAGIIDVDQLQVIEGVIEKKGVDTFRIKGVKGKRFKAVAAARCFGSPLDGVLTLKDPDGKIVARGDDTPSALNTGMIVQQCDPEIDHTFEKDGIYELALADVTSKGGKDYRYLLRTGPLMPDFEVYTVKSGITLPWRGGGSVKFCARRLDGFKGQITITGDIVRKHRNKVECIPENKDEAFINLVNPAKGNTAPKMCELYAEAVINGKTVRKKVIAADIYNQAFAYDHLLDTDGFCLATRYYKPRKVVRPKKSVVRKAPVKKAPVKAAPVKKTSAPAVKKNTPNKK